MDKKDILGLYKNLTDEELAKLANISISELEKIKDLTDEELEKVTNMLIDLPDLSSNDKRELTNILKYTKIEGAKNKVTFEKFMMFLVKIGSMLRADIKEIITNVLAKVINEKIK